MQSRLAIDGNSIAHAHHNATKLSVGGFEVQAIFGFVRSLRMLMEDAGPGTIPTVLWDGRAEHRFAIYPEYKGNRDNLDAKALASKEARQRQMPILEHMIEALGVTQIRSPVLEADDLAWHVVRTKAPDSHITLVSGDRDWIQLVRPNVVWFDPIRDRKVHAWDFFEQTGYKTPEAFTQGKALQGDTSDNVPGVGGIGEKGAPLFLAQWGSVENFFKAYDEGKAGRLGKRHEDFAKQGRAAFERNMNLMDLTRCPPVKAGDLVIRRGKLDEEKFKAICTRLNFASILRELPKFMRVFTPIKERIAA